MGGGELCHRRHNIMMSQKHVGITANKLPSPVNIVSSFALAMKITKSIKKIYKKIKRKKQRERERKERSIETQACRRRHAGVSDCDGDVVATSDVKVLHDLVCG